MMVMCLNPELINRYLTGSCTTDETQEVEAHLVKCEACRQQFSTFRKSSMVIDQSNKEYGSEIENRRTDADNESIQDEYPTMPLGSETTSTFGKQAVTAPLEAAIKGYKILEELPRGGQAVVYKAIHSATKTKVALKILLPSLVASARARRYFEREAELIASLEHPNIVKIRDSGIALGQYYFAMEYIRGQSLDRYVSSNNLSFRVRMELFHKICTAMTYAHQRGVIHRDLKSANILVDDRGEPHVLDFGLAKTASDLSMRAGNSVMPTMTGQWGGSLAYMSPEQAAGRPDLIDVRTDVYSLGVILYQMLLGQFPYDVSVAMLKVLENIQKTEPLKPKRINRKFNSEVEAILLTALAKEPSDRYQSAAELGRDVKHWLQGMPISAKSNNSLYLIRKLLNRHRYASAVVGLLLLIVIGFSCFSFELFIELGGVKSDLQETQQKLKHTEERSAILAQQAGINRFLMEWHAGRLKEAKFVSSFFGRETREAKAAGFLLGTLPFGERERKFRQNLGLQESHFVEFIIGEYYLKNEDRTKALQAYKQCLKSGGNFMNDAWIKKRAQNKILELSTNS